MTGNMETTQESRKRTSTVDNRPTRSPAWFRPARQPFSSPVVNTLKLQSPSGHPIRHLKNQNAPSGSKAARRAAANPAHPAVSRLSAHRKASLFPLSSPLTLAPSLISCPFSHLRRTVSLPVFSRLSLYWIYRYPKRRPRPSGFAGKKRRLRRKCVLEPKSNAQSRPPLLRLRRDRALYFRGRST